MSRHAGEPVPSAALEFLDDDEEHDDAGRGGDASSAPPARTGPAVLRTVLAANTGTAAAAAGLLFVVFAWLGTTGLAQAVLSLFPSSERTIDGGGAFGGSTYGPSPVVVPLVAFGVRSLLVVIALGFGWRARRHDGSWLAGACLAAAGVSLLLFVAGAAVGEIAHQLGHDVSGLGYV